MQVYADLLTEFGRRYDGRRAVTQGLDAKQGSALGTEAHIAAVTDTKQEHWLPENWATDVLMFGDEARRSFAEMLHKAATMFVEA